MGLVLKYVQTTRAGTLHYRRKVPQAHRSAFGSTEWKRLLGNTQREAIAAYPKIHAEYERLLAVAVRGPQQRPSVITALDHHAEAAARLRRIPDHVTDDDRDVWADTIVDAYPRHPEDGTPVGMPEPERLFVNGLRNALGPRPEPTFEDAKRLYVREKVGADETARLSRADRVAKFVKDGLGRNAPLGSIGREGARDVRDHMLRELGMKPATVRRYLNDIRAIVAHAILEYELKGLDNPFFRMNPKADGTPARQQRTSFTEGQLAEVQLRLAQHASTDLQHIFRILAGTGCRLSEVTGLLVSDVFTDHDLPYINLDFRPHRRLKNAASVRRVPLLGDALRAAKDALRAAGSSDKLFPLYGVPRGGDNASAALMKHVREVVADPKVTNHSARHLMEDRMIVAGVDEYDRNLVLGHSRAGMGDRYGTDDARLVAATRALKLTFDRLSGTSAKRRPRKQNR